MSKRIYLLIAAVSGSAMALQGTMNAALGKVGSFVGIDFDCSSRRHNYYFADYPDSRGWMEQLRKS